MLTQLPSHATFHSIVNQNGEEAKGRCFILSKKFAYDVGWNMEQEIIRRLCCVDHSLLDWIGILFRQTTSFESSLWFNRSTDISHIWRFRSSTSLDGSYHSLAYQGMVRFYSIFISMSIPGIAHRKWTIYRTGDWIIRLWVDIRYFIRKVLKACCLELDPWKNRSEVWTWGRWACCIPWLRNVHFKTSP